VKKISKKQKEIRKKIDFYKQYNLEEASKLVKKTSFVRFNASVDISVRLSIDTKKTNHMISGVVFLPHGRGKRIDVLALVPPEKNKEAKESGADYVGLEEYLSKIREGWVDFDIIVTMPSLLPKLGILGRILGPRGLMPNPKSGTVTLSPGKAIREIKSGKINFLSDRYGIVNASIGKVSFSTKKIKENAQVLIQTLNRFKPIKSIYLSNTMGPGISIDPKKI
jgi:large subunit ribosomal protein L1